jgi:hypothetical protein
MDSYGRAFMAEVAAAAIGGPLDIATAPVVHLAQAPFTPGPNVALADITEATFDGYAAKSIAGFGPPILLPNGSVGANISTVLSWTPTGSMTPNTIAGWLVQDHAGNMVSNGAFTPPVLLSGAGTNLSFVWGFSLTGGPFTSTQLP